MVNSILTSRLFAWLSSFTTVADYWAVVRLVGMMVLSAILEVAGIGLIVPFVAILGNPSVLESHAIVANVYVWSASQNASEFMIVASIAVMLFFLAKNGFLIYLQWKINYFVSKQEVLIGKRLLTGYLHLPHARFFERGATELQRRISTEVSRTVFGVLLPLLTLISEVLVTIAITVLLLYAEPRTTLIAILVLGGFAWVAQSVFRSKLASLRDQRLDSGTKMYKWSNNALTNYRAVYLSGRAAHFVSKYERHAIEYVTATSQFTTMNTLPRVTMETFAVAGILVVICVSLALGVRPEGIFPTVALFSLAAIRLTPSIGKILSSINSIRFNQTALNILLKDFHETRFTAKGTFELDYPPKRLVDGIDLKNVYFRHNENDRWILQDISFGLPQGGVAAIVGESGAGKSTLLDLILGIVDPVHGEILVDQAPLKVEKRNWQKAIGYVPQEVCLIDDTVRRNVAFGFDDGEIDDERVWRALRMARMESAIRILPLGLSSLVGERGANFSGGERQRIGIARALYENAKVLVLDEPSSALDGKNESELVETILGLGGEHTIFIVTHRLNTVRQCDMIVFLADGCLVAKGSFDALMAGIESFNALVRSDNSHRTPADGT